MIAGRPGRAIPGRPAFPLRAPGRPLSLVAVICPRCGRETVRLALKDADGKRTGQMVRPHTYPQQLAAEALAADGELAVQYDAERFARQWSAHAKGCCPPGEAFDINRREPERLGQRW